MGKAKEVKFFNDRYCGNLPENICTCLDNIIELDKSMHQRISEDSGCSDDLLGIADFRHSIRCMADSDVTNLIEDLEELGYEREAYEQGWGTLRSYQTTAVGFMLLAKRCIIGDSVGMGKTVEVAAAINEINNFRVENGYEEARFLVLTQKNLASQFRREMVKFTGKFTTLISSGEQKEIDIFVNSNDYHYRPEYSVVGTHALLSTPKFIQWIEQARTMGAGFPFDILVIDESSFLGGRAKKSIDGYKAISKYFDYIFFLNATPFETNLQVFYNQLNLLDPTLLPTKTNFTKEYCIMNYTGMYPKPTGRYKNQGQFKHLIGYRYFARTRKDNGAEMINSDGGVRLSPLSKVQKEWLKKSQLHRVVFDCPTYLDSSIEFNADNVPKLVSLRELLNNECADADSIIIFVYFKEAQRYLSEYLSNRGISNRVLNGDTDNTSRQTIIDGFKLGSYRVLITNVQRGLNFGSCNYCIFYSFDPNPSAMIQFEGRITRDFNIEDKHIYILCSEGEEYKKLNEVVRLRAKATSEFTNTDLSVVMNVLLGED